MKFQTIQRQTTPEMVIQEILRSIRSGDLKRGDKLPPERDLTKMFGVGRSSIREAIVALVLVGQLEVIRGKGTFVRKDAPAGGISSARLRDILAAENILELMELREILESHVARLASERIRPEDLQRVRKTLLKMKNNKAHLSKFYQSDFEFHAALAEGAGNEMIHEMMKLLLERAHRYYARLLPEPLCEAEEAIRSAEGILNAVAEGEGQKAMDWMVVHLRIVHEELKAVVPEVNPRICRRRHEAS